MAAAQQQQQQQLSRYIIEARLTLLSRKLISKAYSNCRHGSQCMRCRVYENVGRPSVCLCVRQSRRPASARRCGGFAVAGPAGRKYRSIAARPALSSKRRAGSRCQLT